MMRIFAYFILMIYFAKKYWNDLNELAKQNQQLQLSAQVFKEAYEGIMITNPEAIMVDINPAFSQMTGYSRAEVLGKNPKILNSGKQDCQFYREMWKILISQGYWTGEIWNLKKAGKYFAALLSISALKDSEGKTSYYVGMFSDITQTKIQQETLELMAHYDVLTNLPNRFLFADRFTQAIARSKRNHSILAVCFLDLDNFKPINDNFGHHVGDKLLIEVSKRIIANIREEDTLSRQGGDEFTLLLGNIDSASHCKQVLKRIYEAITQPCLIDGHSLNISISSGITLYPNDDADLYTLIRHADQAMYQAKLAGGNTFHFFNTEDNNYIIDKQHQLKKIQLALANNEFCLYYQPKVDKK